MAGDEWFTLHFKSVNHVSEIPFRAPPFMWARCPTVLFLLLASPVLHSFDMAALS